ncbi:AAA family ATPase [Rhizobium sp. LjRoot98]|uniref:AAA family ATPase n=1 Tax=Rhizobium sp. LjRoot98 TaxID=3342345 RepID=UPI003ED066BD
MTDEPNTDNRSGGFTIVFQAKAPQDAHEIPDNTILIAPSGDRFDDFRFKTRVKVFVRRSDWFCAIDFNSMIGFVQPTESEFNGADLIERKASKDIFATDFPPFFTLAPELEIYRYLVKNLGIENARDILLSIGDLVSLREFQPQSPVLKSAPQTQVFRMSLTRTAEAFFAYHNAGSILRGLEYEEKGRMSSAIALDFKLDAFANRHELQFNFDQTGYLPKHLAVLIGKNGVGKSQTLTKIAEYALRGEGLQDPATGERAQFNRLLAFAPTKESLSVFPTTARKRQYVRYSRFALARSSGTRRVPSVVDAIIQVARRDDEIVGRSRWDIFRTAVEGLNSSGPISLLMQDGTPVPISGLNRGSEERRLERYGKLSTRRDPVRIANGKALRLSSGEISFLRFAAFVSLEIENGSLLLFDEPETHLHPNFISQFVQILNRLLSETGSSAIIATHSVYFLREVFREQISILRDDGEGGIDIQRPRLATFGANIGEISHFVFGEDEPSYLAQELEAKIRSDGLPWEEVLESYQSELSLEFLNRLRAKIGR